MRRAILAVLIVLLVQPIFRNPRAQIVISSEGSLIRETKTMPKGTGLLMGRTLDPGSGQPVPGVVVSLSLASGPSVAALTDSAGRFVFRGLPAGTFSFFATKTGYAVGKYGKHLPDTGLDVSTDGQSVTLADDEHRGDLVIKMWKFAAFGGTVRDERGEPVVGVTVRALPVVYAGGRRRFASSGTLGGQSDVTDDRGMFRLSALIPGEYAVVVPIALNAIPRSLQRLLAAPGAQPPAAYSASTYAQGWTNGSTPRAAAFESTKDSRVAIVAGDSPGDRMTPIAGQTSDGRLLIYETQFFPSVSSLTRASTVTLGSGEERSGVDFNLRPVTAVSVSGTVTGPDGPAADMTVSLVSADASVMTSDPDLARTVTDADGTFVFPAVTPGEYTVKVLVVPRPRQPPPQQAGTVVQTTGGMTATVVTSAGQAVPTDPTLWAERPISVGSSDIADVALSLRAGPRVTGRLEFQGATPPPAGRFTGFYLERADGTQSTNLQLLLGRIDAQGNAGTSGEPPGKYYVRVPYPVPGWHFVGSMLGGRDLSVTPLEIGDKDIEGVVLTFSDKPGAAISGTVRADRAAVDFAASVAVFPVSRETWGLIGQNPPDYRSVGVLAGGKYVVSDLPAGEYFVAALPESRRDWSDPATLEILARTAARVKIGAGEMRTQDLSVSKPGSELELEDDPQPPGHGPWVEDDQSQTSPRDARPAAPSGSGVIAGVVETGNPRQPVRRAQVALSGSALLGGRVIITDDDGRFVFADVPAGRFTLTARKPAYLTATYGASRPGRPGTAITLIDGQRVTDIKLTMSRGAVITGAIRDAQGQPVSGATIQLLQYRTTNGERHLVRVDTGFGLGKTTDDRGVYRFFGLEPGEYIVAGTAGRSMTPAREVTASDVQFAESVLKRGAATAPPVNEPAKTMNFAPVFYPGTSNPAEALVVSASAEKDATGIDFVLRPVPAVSISGVLSSGAGALPSNVEVRLVNTGDGAGLEAFPVPVIPTRPGPGGVFTFTGVVPGHYVVVATTAAQGRGAGPSSAPMQWAQAEVLVSGIDIDNLQLTLQPGLTVSGTVAFDATTLKPPSLADMRVSLAPMLSGGQISVSQGIVQVRADGGFELGGVTPGRYLPRAIVPAGTSGWIVRASTLDGRDVMDAGLEVKAGDNITGLTITYTDRTTEISGTLQDASGRPAPDYFIIAFCTDTALWRSGSRRIQQTRPATDGKFSVKNLPPGTYYMAALTDVAPGEWYDPAFLNQLVSSAIRIGLAEGERKVQDLQIRK